MNAPESLLIGVGAFLLFAALGAAGFFAASFLTKQLYSSARAIYMTRLLLMIPVVILVWAVSIPFTGRAWTGGHGPGTADRHARWEARSSGAFYGAHTVWAWCVAAIVSRPKSGQGRVPQG